MNLSDIHDAERLDWLAMRAVRYKPARGGIGNDGPGCWVLDLFIGFDERIGQAHGNPPMPSPYSLRRAIDAAMRDKIHYRPLDTPAEPVK